MPDIATIGAVLNSLKTATDIAKFLRESDLSLERAELRLKVADLMGALADVKMELIDVQQAFEAREQRIRELEDAFHSKEQLVRHGDAYYRANAAGKAEGLPYCLRCWESDHKQRQLVRDAREFQIVVCAGCGAKYSDSMAYEIPASTV